MGKMEIKYITKNEPLVLDKKDLGKTKLPLDEKQSFWELRGVSLDIVQGEAIGVIGTNGSGKQTLIDILAGTVKQTTGFITIDGKINRASASRGLEEDLTGLQNIRKAIMAADLDEIKVGHLCNAIVNFVDLGEWLYRPVRDYSLGVYARLSLGIALFVAPKLVLLDSVLNNLDNIFHIKVAQKIQALKDMGVSFIVADTNVFNIERFCERTLWLNFGVAQGFGPTRDVLEQFEYHINWFRALSLPEKNDYLAENQKKRLNFDVASVYETFKVEQFKHGFTRKDEPRMRKAFYKEHGADPVNKESIITKDKKDISQSKNSQSKVKYIVGILAVVVIVAAVWLSFDSHIFAGFGDSKSSQTIAEKNKQTQKSVSKKQKSSESQSSTKAVSESESKAKASSSQAASSSSAAAASESSAKAASESKANLMKNTQTINVSDGDTLEGLAQKYATTADKIREINSMNSDSQLKSGDIIRVPK
ncbi:ABC transporter ATP-binding protein [Liquorilactobacillus sucicola DSM 21376 = JCM 15457]|uniref:Teichoic acid translocation ATP-binding protein n=1 Tax=Liquorilactobacillus sucicola DSM 21376 = JCM 15457 TaxID=1423806 RepID=A0A023CZF3_9LACO|nr:ATP-binding cassette domain-containing protein [Liquorilactobacillus sucicola]KRN05822.1 Teichoic acid translocation ATP-binding protein [Liquorilactobacillus sucicola DSM 21376 = JCM 15457]GAJ27298.1 ABC transporter ATP-binding protein [Liquorilactobacillus sucicola DSM 21376 = JCM 15457]